MDAETMRPGSWEDQKGKLDKNSDFHLEEKKDKVEILINERGWDGAFQEIEEKFDINPDDSENRRQLELIVRLDDARKAKIRAKLSH